MAWPYNLNALNVLIIYNNDFVVETSDVDVQNKTDDVFKGELARAGVLAVVDAIKRVFERNYLNVVRSTAISTLEQLEVLLEREKNRGEIDLIVNLCESLGKESTSEIEVVKVLEKCNIAFTGNSSLTLARCLNKYACTSLLWSNKVSVPKSFLISSPTECENFNFPFPCIVKPNQEDGSTGIDFKAVVDTKEKLIEQVERLIKSFTRPVLVQKYIEGREINVSLIGSSTSASWGVSEIDFSSYNSSLPKILNYSSKWECDSHEYRSSVTSGAHLSASTKEKILLQARRCSEVLKLQGYARIDMRLDSKERPYIIDVNPNCDLDPSSGLSRTFSFQKLDYTSVVYKIVEDAFRVRETVSIPMVAAAAGPIHFPSVSMPSIINNIRSRLELGEEIN